MFEPTIVLIKKTKKIKVMIKNGFLFFKNNDDINKKIYRISLGIWKMDEIFAKVKPLKAFFIDAKKKRNVVRSKK